MPFSGKEVSVVQVLPFHRARTGVGMPWLVRPTAQAVLAAVTATPVRMLSPCVPGLSFVLARDHALPFQRKTSGAMVVALRLAPTDQPLLAVSVTPYSAPPIVAALVTWLHAF